MTSVATTTVPANDLPVHRIALPGTRALTVLVAFDAGARTERPAENGMAHFLEHLVFKGGEKYPTYTDVNETAERLGGVLNAYTSHDLVAFHITVRAESAAKAIDLLSDFVGRPRIDAEELDRERGVVIQEINRAYDQPSTVAEYLIDRAAFGEHPLGRTVLGPEEHLRSFTRDAIVAFRERRWAGARGGAFLVGNLDHLPDDSQLHELFARFPRLPEPEPYVPAPAFAPETLVEQRDTNQSHLRMIYRPAVEVSDRRQPRRAGDLLDAARRLDGLAPVRRDPRETRPVLLGLRDRPRLRRRPDPAARLGPRRRISASRPTPGCGRSWMSCARRARREEEVARARAYAAGRLVLAFENTNAVARHAAAQSIVFGEEIDPDAAIAALDAVTFDEVRDVAAGVADELAIACVGPHAAGEF